MSDQTIDIQGVRTAIVDQANAAHRQYPQYAGHWDGPEWRVVRVTRRVETKMGVAFEAGDVTIGNPDADHFWAYSFRNNIDTAVAPDWVDVLEGPGAGAPGFWDDAELISSYSRADALRDGVLVSTQTIVSDEPDFAAQAGFMVPVALTTAAASLIYPTPREAERYGQDAKGRLWDVLNMARHVRPRPMPTEGATWMFPVIMWLAGSERGVRRATQKTLRLKATIGPGDDGSPVVTIMLGSED